MNTASIGLDDPLGVLKKDGEASWLIKALIIGEGGGNEYGLSGLFPDMIYCEQYLISFGRL